MHCLVSSARAHARPAPAGLSRRPGALQPGGAWPRTGPHRKATAGRRWCHPLCTLALRRHSPLTITFRPAPMTADTATQSDALTKTAATDCSAPRRSAPGVSITGFMPSAFDSATASRERRLDGVGHGKQLYRDPRRKPAGRSTRPDGRGVKAGVAPQRRRTPQLSCCGDHVPTLRRPDHGHRDSEGATDLRDPPQKKGGAPATPDQRSTGTQKACFSPKP